MKDVFVNTLVELRAARAEWKTSEKERMPVLRVELLAVRHDRAGRHPPFTMPPLWLEPREVRALIQALEAALAREIPETMLEEPIHGEPSALSPARH